MADSPGTFPFDPVPVAPRRDGWTFVRQRAFIAALAQVGCVKRAASAVGMTPKSAYRLRARADAASFAAAWDAAQAEGVALVEDSAVALAIHGEPRPVFYGGRQVGTRIHYDTRLMLAVLRRYKVTRGHPGSPLPDNGWAEFSADVP